VRLSAELLDWSAADSTASVVRHANSSAAAAITQEGFDLLIGADGLKSPIRARAGTYGSLQ